MTAADDFIHFHKPSIGEEEIAAVLEILRSGWLTTGSQSRAFEQEFAGYVGARHAVAVNSCTAGLHLALEAHGIASGDKVLTTPYTFTASAEVIRYLGADPVFVDVDPDTFNICPERVAAEMSSRQDIRAILPVHIAGQACDLDPLLESARHHDAALIEDAAHALPATYHGSRIGSLGDATVFSFYVTKTLAVGEGGMLVTDHDKVAKRARMMRLHGIDRDVYDRAMSSMPTWYYEVVAPGYKYNLSDIAAAIGRVQLRRLESLQQRRAEIAARYTRGFSDLPVRTPELRCGEDTHAWHLYILRLDIESLDIDRNRFIELMAEAGVGTSVHFIPLYLQPYWRDRYGLKADDFPVASDLYSRAVSLPIYPLMDDAAVEKVIEAARRILIQYQR